MTKMKSGPYRGGRVHILAEQCSTCVFRPGNLMHLSKERMRELIEDNQESALTCHATLYRDDVAPAVCRGFADRYDTLPLVLAHATGIVVYDAPPREEP